MRHMLLLRHYADAAVSLMPLRRLFADFVHYADAADTLISPLDYACR